MKRPFVGHISDKNSPAVQEALTRILEEASEVQKCAAKALRFGLYPGVVDGEEYDNFRDIYDEMLDLQQAHNELVRLETE